jgi:nitroreductase
VKTTRIRAVPRLKVLPNQTPGKVIFRINAYRITIHAAACLPFLVSTQLILAAISPLINLPAALISVHKQSKEIVLLKPAVTTYPIHDLLKNRWSPRAFSPQPVAGEDLLSLFEAARWSPSGGNTQPWGFIVTIKDEGDSFDKLLATLSERNQVWAKHAPLLVLAVGQSEREPGKPNAYASYDLGQAVAHLSIQASALGIAVHQMAGFDQQKACAAFALPSGFNPVTVIAIGYPGDPQSLPSELRERELSGRVRKPLSEFAFNGAWNTSLEK